MKWCFPFCINVTWYSSLVLWCVVTGHCHAGVSSSHSPSCFSYHFISNAKYSSTGNLSILDVHFLLHTGVHELDVESLLVRCLRHLPRQMWRQADPASLYGPFIRQLQLKHTRMDKHGLLVNRSCTWETVRASFDCLNAENYWMSDQFCVGLLCRLLTGSMFVVRRTTWQHSSHRTTRPKLQWGHRLHWSSLASLVVWLQTSKVLVITFP